MLEKILTEMGDAVSDLVQYQNLIIGSILKKHIDFGEKH